MTRETFDIARNILADIESLKNIKSEYENNHFSAGDFILWRGCKRTTKILRDDLEKFIDAEITKLEEELEKL